MTVNELKLRQPEQVVGMVHSLLGTLGCHLVVLPEEGRKSQLLQLVFQQQL